MNNKEFIVNIPMFYASTYEDVAKALAEVMATFTEHTTDTGEIEKPFSKFGIEVEINTQN